LNIVSDDTKDTLSVERGDDGDVWVGVNNFNLVRFRSMIGGGMSPNTFVALLNLEKAVKEDLEMKEKGRSLMSEWSKALKKLS